MTQTAAPPYAERLQTVRAALPEHELDALLILGPANRRYLSGFTAQDGAIGESSGALLVTPSRAAVVTSPLYSEQAKAEAHGMETVELRGRWKRKLPELLKEWGVRSLGFERDYTLYGFYEDLLEEMGEGARLVPLKDVVEQLRLLKDPAEKETMRAAARIADEAYALIVGGLAPGITEREAARKLDDAMLALGAEGPSFGTIVAAGPNAARPHHEPGGHVLQAGEPVIIDMGARFEGYTSDMTRSFCLGSADGRYAEVYDAVLRAHEAGKAAIRDGADGKATDAVARDLLKAAGYDDEFSHSLGHGLGMDVHEDPSLSRESEDTLRAGMVVSVEPGVYITGWGGVRIEDTVFVTDTGCEALNGAPKEPVV